LSFGGLHFDSQEGGFRARWGLGPDSPLHVAPARPVAEGLAAGRAARTTLRQGREVAVWPRSPAKRFWGTISSRCATAIGGRRPSPGSLQAVVLIHAPAGELVESRSVHSIGGNSAKAGLFGDHRARTDPSRPAPKSNPRRPARPSPGQHRHEADRGRLALLAKSRRPWMNTPLRFGGTNLRRSPPMRGNGAHIRQARRSAPGRSPIRAERCPCGSWQRLEEFQVCAEIGEGLWPPGRCRQFAGKGKKADVGIGRTSRKLVAWLSTVAGCGRSTIAGLVSRDGRRGRRRRPKSRRGWLSRSRTFTHWPLGVLEGGRSVKQFHHRLAPRPLLLRSTKAATVGGVKVLDTLASWKHWCRRWWALRCAKIANP